MKKHLGFSIVVATYNLRSYLESCLQSLLRIDYEPYEIIIVNDGSTDDTRKYLDTLTDPRIRIIHQTENSGTCHARNRGIAATHYPLIAFTDHDCLVSPDWLTRLESYFISGTIGLVFGRVDYIKSGYVGYFPERLVRNPDARWPMGCNMAMRKSTLEQIGGFAPLMFPYGNEDTEIALRAVTHGILYRHAPDIAITHQAIDWKPRSLLRSARYAAAWPILKNKYPDHYRHFGSPINLGIFVNAEDYIYFLTLPLLVPALLLRYLMHGKRDLKIFFTRWTTYLFLRRYYIWREAWRQRVALL